MTTSPISADTIHRHIATIQGKIDGLDQTAIDRLTENAKLDTSDWATFGPFASEMMLFGLLDLAAAGLLHRIHTEYNGGDATLAERIIFMQIMGEYLGTRGDLISAHSA